MFSKHVTVETGKTDRYGRRLGKVLVDGVVVTLEQVRAGFAWHYKAYEWGQSADDRVVYARAEAGPLVEQNPGCDVGLARLQAQEAEGVDCWSASAVVQARLFPHRLPLSMHLK